MGSNNLIIRDYLESLKEDSELDYLFPILLNLMGHRIVSTPKDSKGQPQFGKDVITVGTDEDGVKKRFYFELKGFTDKDIDDTIFYKRDGIRESLLASKDAAFNDRTIPGFNDLPFKVILVHNGILKSNTRPVFEGFIQKEFPDGNCERWDIHKLTDLFGEFLLSEYLLTDEESIRLFKRTLILLDAPEYDFKDFKLLIEAQVKKSGEIKGRALKKLFATLNLLSLIIIHYSKENNNLTPAKNCVTYLLLRTWRWILVNKMDNRAAVITEFRKLVDIHFKLLDDYFLKTLGTALKTNGLFYERGRTFETIGYPLRSFEYINYLIYYFEARLFWPGFIKGPTPGKTERLREIQKMYLKQLIRNNLGAKRPIIDGHLIGILNVFQFFFRHNDLIRKDREFLANYLNDLIGNILITFHQHKRLPELRNNIKALSDFLASGNRPKEYEDRSTLLITILFELTVLINAPDIYTEYRNEFLGKVNLQTADTDMADDEFELKLFEKSLHEEYYVETGIDLPDDINTFKATLLKKMPSERNFRTDKAGFPYLRLLAHIYFENEFLPIEWRRYLS